MEPEVTYTGVLDMQVCVPSNWSNERVEQFANTAYPCGTMHGWDVRKQGDRALAGAAERVSCSEKVDFVHIMLDA